MLQLLNKDVEKYPWAQVTQPCFSQITRGEILNYRQQIEDFAKRFYREGPGSVGEDLDRGKDIHISLTEAFEDILLKNFMGRLDGVVVYKLACTLGSSGDL